MKSLRNFRLEYQPALPRIFLNFRQLGFSASTESLLVKPEEEVLSLFPKTATQPIMECHNSTLKERKPLKVGVFFSGGQAPGGHNVVAALFDALKLLHNESSLLGFLGGPDGLLKNTTQLLSKEILDGYRNQGGFDLLGSGRTKIETEEQLKSAAATSKAHALDGLVVIGGDDSNTNAALLAEFFLREGLLTKVVGIPKTIDGDLQNPYVPISFGFDTACKIYAEMIGNIQKDALSAKKYTHFIKLMGRSASHITLECAFHTHPNLILIGEEVAAKNKTLQKITEEIADLIEKRAKLGKNYGVILIPEGLIEFIPEMKILLEELNQLLAKGALLVEEGLSTPSRNVYHALPEGVQKALLGERDSHGNVQVSFIETERLLIDLVTKELSQRGVKYNPISHFFGYEGRSGYPSNFDCKYTAALGYTAALLIDEGLTGYMAAIQGLHLPTTEWSVKGIPIAALLNMEEKSGRKKPVIRKALVDLHSRSFTVFEELRKHWELSDEYQSPGPMQFFGDPEITDSAPKVISLRS